MSATGRSDVRRPHDVYETPPWVVSQLFAELPHLAADSVLDPFAATGGILRVALEHGAHSVSGWDIRPECRTDLEHVCGSQNVWIGDALRKTADRTDTVVTNPPYKLAFEAVRWFVPRARRSAWLLRLAFAEGQARNAWLRANPPSHVLVLSKRPSFTGRGTDATAYAWFVWDRTYGPASPQTYMIILPVPVRGDAP